jgi:phosphoserine phosphatase
MTSTGEEAVWLFDLDGTLLEVNSFSLWAARLLRGDLPHLSAGARAVVSARCAAALISRKVLGQSHLQFKRRLQRLWGGAITNDAQRLSSRAFVEELVGHVRPNLRPLLGDVAAQRNDAILTTAAAGEYAAPLAQRLGFRHLVATPAGGRGADNVGETKREQTLAYLERAGWAHRRRILFTDHLEDTPLILASDWLVWLGEPHDCPRLSSSPRPADALAARELSAEATYRWVIERSRQDVPACT